MSQKLDMLGIGMQHNQNDPNGIAWRQNRDFENLLQRLNNGTEAIGSFHKARESSPSEVQEVAAEVVDSAHDDVDEGANATKLEKKKRQKKRKALREEEEEIAHEERERKKRKKSKSDVAPADDCSPSLETQAAAATTMPSEPTPVPITPIAAPAPIRALYVADSRLVLNSQIFVYFTTARALTAPVSSQPSAWPHLTPPRSPKFLASPRPHLPPPPPLLPLHLHSPMPPPRRLQPQLPPLKKKTRCRN